MRYDEAIAIDILASDPLPVLDASGELVTILWRWRGRSSRRRLNRGSMSWVAWPFEIPSQLLPR